MTMNCELESPRPNISIVVIYLFCGYVSGPTCSAHGLSTDECWVRKKLKINDTKTSVRKHHISRITLSRRLVLLDSGAHGQVGPDWGLSRHSSSLTRIQTKPNSSMSGPRKWAELGLAKPSFSKLYGMFGQFINKWHTLIIHSGCTLGFISLNPSRPKY